MDTTAKLQLVETTQNVCAFSAKTKTASARDFSQNFHAMVVSRFVATQSLKQTARDYSIPARVVSEILHLANLRRPMAIARASATAFLSIRETRRIA